jgi:hypothetical protein
LSTWPSRDECHLALPANDEGEPTVSYVKLTTYHLAALKLAEVDANLAVEHERMEATPGHPNGWRG